jgi:NDP-sugar pyrophosphorylase family protein
MKAVILAGGFGSRLKTVVSDVPKPLAPIIGDECFLDILLKKLISSGFEDFVFCLYYMHELFEERYGNGKKLGVKIQYSIEDLPLGTAGAIGLLRKSVTERFFVFNADTYLSLDYADFAAEHMKKNALISMALTYVKNTGRYGRVQFEDQKNVTLFEEKRREQAGGYISAGVYLLEPEVFKYIPEHKSSFEDEIFPAILNDGGRISVYCDTSDFIDIGVPEDYRHFIEYYAGKHAQFPVNDENRTYPEIR